MAGTEHRQPLKAWLKAGNTAVNGWCSIPSPITAEIIARQGYDTVTVDLQHGLLDYRDALVMAQAIAAADVPSLARVPWNEPGIIMKVLDAGFSGVICPMVNTREDAERLVQWTHYAPAGSRSFGPTRAALLHGADYSVRADELVTVFAMIETREALANVGEIAAVPGIDGLYVGPSDLGLSLGYAPTLSPSERAVKDAMETIRAAAEARGLLAAVHCGSPEMAGAMLDQGFDLASMITDVRIFATAMADHVARARRARAGRPSGASS